MDIELDRLLAERVALQHAVFDRTLAMRLGFTKDQRAQRIQQGRWRELYEGVYRIAGAPRTWRGDQLAAVLAAGARAGASHRSAAELWEVPGRSSAQHELLCLRWRRPRRAGLIVHETKLLRPWDITVVDAVPVTTIERTLLDLGAVVLPSVVERAVEDGLRRQLTTLDQLAETVERLGRRGRNGAGVLREIVEGRVTLRTITESDMEMRMLQILRRNGLPEPLTQYEIWHEGRFVARVDAAYPQWRIALEYDSYAHHTGTMNHDRDGARRNALVGARWWPITVTWADLKNGGMALCREIRRLAPDLASHQTPLDVRSDAKTGGVRSG